MSDEFLTPSEISSLASHIKTHPLGKPLADAIERLMKERDALIARLKTADERIERLRDRIEGEYRACSCKDDVGASISDICAASSHHVDCVICEERLAVLRADAALASRPHDPK